MNCGLTSTLKGTVFGMPSCDHVMSRHCLRDFTTGEVLLGSSVSPRPLVVAILTPQCWLVTEALRIAGKSGAPCTGPVEPCLPGLAFPVAVLRLTLFQGGPGEVQSPVRLELCSVLSLVAFAPGQRGWESSKRLKTSAENQALQGTGVLNFEQQESR